MTKNKRGRRASGRKTQASSTDMLIINSHKATGADTTTVRSDIAFRRQNFNIVQTPPKSLSNQIYWLQTSTDVQLNASSTGPTENNYAFTAANFPEFADYVSCFDQYCIYSFVFTFAYMGNASQPVRLYTALDYDSITAVGKTGIQGFSTYQFSVLSSNGSTSLIRYLKPCISSYQLSSSAVPYPSGIQRAWIDCAYSSIAHYGLRTIIDQWVSTANNVVELSITAVFGFRNAI